MLRSWAIFTLCCLVLRAVSGQSEEGECSCSCPSGWHCTPRAQYKYVPEAMSWIDAEVYCQKLQPGAHLASIHSIDENDYIGNIIFQQTNAHPTVWIGGSDHFQNRLFLWVDGSQMDYQNFAPGEPNNYAGVREPCLTFYVSPKTWNDANCELKYTFICKYTSPWPF